MQNNEEQGAAVRLNRQARKLSRFMAQEMLYDYSQNRLDGDRKIALEAQIIANPDLKIELESILLAEAYAKQLAQTKISPRHVDELKKIRPTSQLIVNKMKWRSWPDLLRWSAEALLVSLVVVATAAVLPWEKLKLFKSYSATEVTLAEIEEADPLPLEKLNELVAKSSATLAKDTTAAIGSVVSTDTTVPGKAAAAAAMKEAATTVAATSKAAPTATAGAMATGVEPMAAASITQKSRVASSNKGLLINIRMDPVSTPEIAKAVREKIIAGGGVKAGQVELGWRKKNPDGNYYHFTMPEVNYESFIAELGVYSALRIYKSPHERVLPEGQVRIILWIEDKK